MKKIISVLLIVAMLISVFAMSATATEFDASKFKYFEKTVEFYGVKYIDEIMYNYDELYYHYSDNNQEEPDWALLFCVVRPDMVNILCGTVVGNRVLAITGGGCIRFDYGYGVYIKETDSIVSLTPKKLNQIIELCPDFVEAIETNEIGQAFGDVDGNGKIDVMDATYIQRGIAGISNFIYDDFVEVGAKGIVWFSDFDRDGEITVMDATAIQRHIAGIE